jgi:predicted NBD/HSP70 family sugar kinase
MPKFFPNGDTISTATDERAIAAVAVEDQQIWVAIATADGLASREVFNYREGNGPGPLIGVLQDLLEGRLLGGRKKRFACIAISMPGTIDTINCTLLDIPRWEWDRTRERAHGRPLVDFKEVLGSLGYHGKIILENDTTTAALGEHGFQTKAINDRRDFAYIRVGRGVNAAMLVNGRPFHGALHPEMGHIAVRRHERDTLDICESKCTFHSTCLEGLVSSQAIEHRLNRLSDHDLVWEIVAYYLAQLCLMLTLVFAPPHIVIGGSLLRERPRLLEQVREAFIDLHCDYPRYPPFTNGDYIYIRPSQGQELASLAGAWRMAHEAVFSANAPPRSPGDSIGGLPAIGPGRISPGIPDRLSES